MYRADSRKQLAATEFQYVTRCHQSGTQVEVDPRRRRIGAGVVRIQAIGDEHLRAVTGAGQSRKEGWVQQYRAHHVSATSPRACPADTVSARNRWDQ